MASKELLQARLKDFLHSQYHRVCEQAAIVRRTSEDVRRVELMRLAERYTRVISLKESSLPSSWQRLEN